MGTSLHDVLARLKAQPQVYPTIDISYSLLGPVAAPIILNLPANGLRLRFDGPDQKLRLIEVLEFSKIQMSYKNQDVVKLLETEHSTHGPTFRHVYDRLIGPGFPGKYIPPSPGSGSQMGCYILSYPGIAFTFPIQDSAWSPNVNFVSALSSSAAAPATSMAVFNGASWQEACQDLYSKPSSNPKLPSLLGRGKETYPEDIDLIKVRGNGRIDLLRKSGPPFQIRLSETTPQDLVAELGPPDAIYVKSDRRLSIHKAQQESRKTGVNRHGASPIGYEERIDTDESSTHSATDELDEDESSGTKPSAFCDRPAECFYNYFRHGLDVFISRPSNRSPCFPHSEAENEWRTKTESSDQLVATKILLHANVPGSYPFNRYRRSRWFIDAKDPDFHDSPLDSESPFPALSDSLQRIWHDSPLEEIRNQSYQRGMPINRDWDSPGSSCELLGGWEESTDARKKSKGRNDSPGYGNTEMFGFPGLVFEVLNNDIVSCLTVY